MEAAEVPAIYPARPTLSVDGQVDAALSESLSALEIEETSLGLFQCELSFENWGPRSGGYGYQLFDGRKLTFGTRLKVDAGAGDAGGELFSGRISAVEGRYRGSGPPLATFLAEDELGQLRMRRRSRVHEGTDGEIAQRIAQEHGLSADVATGGPHRVVAQLNVSDLGFLRDRARATGCEVWVDDGALCFKARPDRQGAAAITLRYQDRLHECSISADLAEQRTALIVSGWDPGAKAEVSHEAGASLIAGELVAPQRSGPAHLEQAFGARKETWVHALATASDDARGRAESAFRAAARRFVTGRCQAEGDVRIRVGARVELVGLGAFDGEYYVSEASHRFSRAGGYATTFSVERAGFAFG